MITIFVLLFIALVNAYSYIQSAYANLGLYDSAYFYLRKYYRYNDSIYSESNQRKFDNLRIELATLEKEQEISNLRQDRTISRLKSRVVIIVLVFGIFLISAIFFYYRIKQRAKERKLKRDLELNNQQLTNHALSMVHKNNGFLQVEEEINNLMKSDSFSLTKIKKVVTLYRASEKDWKNFNHYFGQVYTDFGEKLSTRFPNLNINEQRLAFLVKMKLKNSEIASILFVEPKSVSMAKYRLKKKMSLDEEEDLSHFLIHKV